MKQNCILSLALSSLLAALFSAGCTNGIIVTARTGPSTPTFTVTPTATNTGTPSVLISPTSTTTNTPTNSPTATPTNTGTQTPPMVTVTATLTGCAKVSVTGGGALPVNPASKGTTATGLQFGIFQMDGPCGPGSETHYITSMGFSVTLTGNLATQVSQVVLLGGSSPITIPFNSAGFTITGSPIGEENNYTLEYVTSATASGTIQTELKTGTVLGYGPAGFFGYFLFGAVVSDPLTIQ